MRADTLRREGLHPQTFIQTYMLINGMVCVCAHPFLEDVHVAPCQLLDSFQGGHRRQKQAAITVVCQTATVGVVSQNKDDTKRSLARYVPHNPIVLRIFGRIRPRGDLPRLCCSGQRRVGLWGGGTVHAEASHASRV